jgi:hypothetical protein
MALFGGEKVDEAYRNYLVKFFAMKKTLREGTIEEKYVNQEYENVESAAERLQIERMRVKSAEVDLQTLLDSICKKCGYANCLCMIMMIRYDRQFSRFL